MKKEKIVLNAFNFSYCKNTDFLFNPNDVKNQEIKKEKVCLPHDIALSVTDYKTPEELYYGCNVLQTQEFEDIHSFYYTDFDAEEGEYILRLNRVDVFSEVYLNGQKVLTTNNAFIDFEQKVLLHKKNSLVIHLLPTILETRKYSPPCGAFTLRYNGSSLYVRKPAHSWGWDIMPRIALGGIFDVVSFVPYKGNNIKETYFYTSRVDVKEKNATLEYAATFDLSGDKYSDYTVETIGVCGDSRFENKDRLWSNHFRFVWWIGDVKLWDVKGFGKPNLYTITTKLYYKGELVDEKVEKIGIRTVELVRTDCCDENEGEFVFKINGRETFIMGTNWVPADALYSNADNRRKKLMPYMDDLGFNMVRVWGGGIYEPDEFYDFCDEHGILVWQDFMMACATYPQDEWFQNEFRSEAEKVVKRLRNHSSIALWSGDNECDYFSSAHNPNLNLEGNLLTRKIIPEVLFMHDPHRAYLPSSPYMSPQVKASKKRPAENHCWGPRDYFKSEYYQTCENAVFISEIGYMSMPNTRSLRKFISGDLCDFASDDYMVHLSNMTLDNPYYKFRIHQDLKPIEYLFGVMPKSIEDIVTCAQIAGAEANKYFLERMRIRKDRKRGIMLWNMAEGWPQLCEAFVDYYFDLKLAYYYVKQSQQPLCMMMDETKEGLLLGFVNDTSDDEVFKYRITDAATGCLLYEGEGFVEANGLKSLMYDMPTNRVFYNIEWQTSKGKGHNHFIANIKDVSLDEYVKIMKACNYDVISLVNNERGANNL